MSIIMTQRCLSAEPWFEVHVPSATETDKTYRVLVPWPDDGVDDLCCECQGFIFRGACYHQELAFETLCRWTSQTGPEEQSPKQRKNHVCPRCGGETLAEAEFE